MRLEMDPIRRSGLMVLCLLSRYEGYRLFQCGGMARGGGRFCEM